MSSCVNYSQMTKVLHFLKLTYILKGAKVERKLLTILNKELNVGKVKEMELDQDGFPISPVLKKVHEDMLMAEIYEEINKQEQRQMYLNIGTGFALAIALFFFIKFSMYFIGGQ